MTNHLRKIRKERGLTQAELASQLGTTEATVSRWETGERGISDAWKILLSEILEISPLELFEYPDARKEPTT